MREKKKKLCALHYVANNTYLNYSEHMGFLNRRKKYNFTKWYNNVFWEWKNCVASRTFEVEEIEDKSLMMYPKVSKTLEQKRNTKNVVRDDQATKFKVLHTYKVQRISE
jgi:hypothetical protein